MIERLRSKWKRYHAYGMTGFIGACILVALIGQFTYKLLFGIDHTVIESDDWSEYGKRTNWIELLSIGVFAAITVGLFVWQYMQKSRKNHPNA